MVRYEVLSVVELESSWTNASQALGVLYGVKW